MGAKLTNPWLFYPAPAVGLKGMNFNQQGPTLIGKPELTWVNSRMNQAYRVTQKCHKYDLLTLPDLTWGQPICNGGGSLHHSKAVNSVGVCYIFNSFYGALLEKKRFYKDS